MFGFWFWVLTPLVLTLVVAFVYDRRHDAMRVKPSQEAPAAGGATDARAAIRHRVHDEHWGTGI